MRPLKSPNSPINLLHELRIIFILFAEDHSQKMRVNSNTRTSDLQPSQVVKDLALCLVAFSQFEHLLISEIGEQVELKG